MSMLQMATMTSFLQMGGVSSGIALHSHTVIDILPMLTQDALQYLVQSEPCLHSHICRKCLGYCSPFALTANADDLEPKCSLLEHR